MFPVWCNKYLKKERDITRKHWRFDREMDVLLLVKCEKE